ncbi:MAG TPA: malto-oligosyltrehalose trehalohydrolase [Acidimicrobiales bacterium]
MTADTVQRFAVWAPEARRVEILVAGRVVALVRGEHGWWSIEVEDAGPGTDYLLSVDGSAGLPDPRSAWQPDGVHGPSRVVDQSGFPWTDQGWRGIELSSSVLYELHVGTFSDAGTFDAAIEHLDHLTDVGVTAVELLPVAEFSGRRGWGYDGVDLYAPHHAYGGPDGLKRLVDACHGRGLGVLLDVVFNHLGPEGNYLERFGPYLTELQATPWGPAVNLDDDRSAEITDFFVDNALMWLRDYHFDGLRLDAVDALVDGAAMSFLQELSRRVEDLAGEVGRSLVLVAESDRNDPRLVQPRQAGGAGLDGWWSDDFHHALHAVLTGERNGYYADFGSLDAVAKAIRQAYVNDGTWSAYRRRVHGRPLPPGLSGHRFVAYLQSHDQVGNRPGGERTGALMSTRRLKVGAALLLTAPFVPMLFQGEEWAAATPFHYFTDHADPSLGRGVADGRLRDLSRLDWPVEAMPNPQDRLTFERSKLDWAERRRPPHRHLLDWYRRLIRLRRDVRELGDGRVDRVRVTVEQEGCLVVRRGPITIACNLGEDTSVLDADGSLLLGSEEDVSLGDGRLHLPSATVGILRAAS